MIYIYISIYLYLYIYIYISVYIYNIYIYYHLYSQSIWFQSDFMPIFPRQETAAKTAKQMLLAAARRAVSFCGSKVGQMGNCPGVNHGKPNINCNYGVKIGLTILWVVNGFSMQFFNKPFYIPGVNHRITRKMICRCFVHLCSLFRRVCQ